jgi:hypothetical protein
MTEVQHLHKVLIVTDSIVNHHRTVLQFAHAGLFSDSAAHIGKPSEQIHVVEQSVAKTGGRLAVVFGNLAEDLGEIAQRLLREEDAVIHLGRSLRTFSIGEVRPASASRIPSSIAARVSSSSSSTTGTGLSKSNFFASAML